MKRKIIKTCLICAVVIVILPALVFAENNISTNAQSASSSTPRQAISTGTPAEKHLSEAVLFRVRRFFVSLGDRIESTINRLSQIADRIDSRIKKFEAQGKDATDAKVKLADARAKIAQAKSAWADAKAKFEAVLSGNNPREAFQIFRGGSMKDVTQALRDAHAALVDAVVILRGMSDTLPGNATSTATSGVSD